jgi:GR25 family glycosyltransferase involved in LPS biosynthesis
LEKTHFHLGTEFFKTYGEKEMTDAWTYQLQTAQWAQQGRVPKTYYELTASSLRTVEMTSDVSSDNALPIMFAACTTHSALRDW